MTVKETCEKLGVSASKLYQLVAARKIPHYRIGGRIVFREEDVAAFLAGCRVDTASTAPAVRSPPLKLKHIRLNRA